MTNCDDHVDQTIKAKEPAQGNSSKFSTESENILQPEPAAAFCGLNNIIDALDKQHCEALFIQLFKLIHSIVVFYWINSERSR